jgi:hypothetical protein
MSRKESGSSPVAVPRRLRRLRPEVAAEMRARNEARRVRELYSRQVAELSPREIALMKAAFFQNS